MVGAFSGCAAVEANIVHAPSQLLEVFANFNPHLSGALELEGALHEISLATLHLGRELVLANEFRHVHFIKFRLGIEGVDMAWAAFHRQKDAGLGLRGNLLGFGGQHARA